MMYGWNGAWGHGPYAYGFPWGGILMGAVLIVLAVFAVVAFIRMYRSGSSSTNPKHRGLEILSERFARGEIDADTYRSMKAELEEK